MKRTTIMGLCLVAVFMMSALAVSTASATSPEYKTCIKANPKNTGMWADKGCSAPAAGNGKYELAEWNQGKKKTFKSKATKPINKLINPATSKTEGFTECANEKGAGELTSPKTSKFVNEYKKCKSAGKNCETVGSGKGKIKTKPLTGTLVSIVGGSGVGNLVKAETGSVLAEYNCEGLEITARGAVIGELQGGKAAAEKVLTTKLQSREGVDGRLQEFMYPGLSNTEAEEDKAQDFFLNFVPKFIECLEDGKSEAECGTFNPGDPDDAVTEFVIEEGEGPAKPVVILSEVQPLNVTAPASQEGTTSVKGEATKIV